MITISAALVLIASFFSYRSGRRSRDTHVMAYKHHNGCHPIIIYFKGCHLDMDKVNDALMAMGEEPIDLE